MNTQGNVRRVSVTAMLIRIAIVFSIFAFMYSLNACASKYQYSMERASELKSDFGTRADLEKYCGKGEEANDELCEIAKTRGRVQEKISNWGFFSSYPQVSPYSYYDYPGYLTNPPFLYRDSWDLMEQHQLLRGTEGTNTRKEGSHEQQ